MTDSRANQYRTFLGSVDKWFGGIQERHAGGMRCGLGCSLCCYGLFDISFPDALIVAEGLSKLPGKARAGVTLRAEELHHIILEEAGELKPPYLLTEMSEERIDEIVEGAQTPRCPFLGEKNECLIYEHRPLACRLEGIPMVDLHDGLFGDWCELNFTEGVSADALRDLGKDYRGMQQFEESLTEHLTQLLLKIKLKRASVLIPSLVVGFESFWKGLLTSSSDTGAVS